MAGSPEVEQPRNEDRTRRERNTRGEDRPSGGIIAELKKKIENARKAKQEGKQTEAQKDQERGTISQTVKEELQKQGQRAKEVAISAESNGQKVAKDKQKDAEQVESVVDVFLEAAKNDLIVPPTHEPSRRVFVALVEELKTRGISAQTASNLQPLINGLLNRPEYISFSNIEGIQTPFEQDLVFIAGNRDVETMIQSIIAPLVAEGVFADLTSDQFKQKFQEAKLTRDDLKEVQRNGRRGDQQSESYVRDLLEQNQSDEDGIIAKEVFEHLNSAADLNRYYRTKFNAKVEDLQTKWAADRGRFSNEDSLRDRASKDVATDIHKALMYLTHRIYAPVLSSNQNLPFNQLVQQASGSMYVNPTTVFNYLRNKIINLKEPVTEQSDYDTGDMKYFQYGDETKEVYVTNTSTDPKDRTRKTGRLVKEQLVSTELQKCGFKDFLRNLSSSMDSENESLQGAVNFNYLMNTGNTEGDKSFFKQAAAYAMQSLPGQRINELYKLPYGDLIEAAKLQISSYYKKKYAMNNWIRDPSILQGMFQDTNKIEKEALVDMIANFRAQKIPEWAIQRAMIHARLHVSLINLEIHGIASYAHAPVNDLANPTYRDPAMKNLDVYRTWYGAEQWRVGDTDAQGIAYLPSASAHWKHEDWNHKDVRAEGEEIYQESFQYGDMARVGRKYFDKDTAPNILELNPMKNGGVESQSGWQLKYPAIPWLTDMLDHLNNDEQMKLDDPRALEVGWKRLENIGVNILKMYKANFLFDHGISEEVEPNYKNFFKFLYRRYFNDGPGKEGFKMQFRERQTDQKEKTIEYSTLTSDEDFWNRVVNPILKREVVVGKGESQKDAEKRNEREKIEELKKIVDQALTIVTYERVPMDFLFMENPSRSQNGVTLLSELRKMFILTNSEVDHDKNAKEVKLFDEGIDDILFVQQEARMKSIDKMSSFVKEQSDREDRQKNLFGRTLGSIKDHDRSQIEIVEGQEKKGYVVNVQVIEKVLRKKYQLDDKVDLDGNPIVMDAKERARREEAVELAVKIYKSMDEKVRVKPDYNIEETNPTVSDARKQVMMKKMGLDPKIPADVEKYKAHLRQEYATYRAHQMTSRLTWSGNEILSGQLALPVNDTAYQFLDFARAGKDMVARTVDGVANMQEKYKNDVAGGELLSALKKYYRKEDEETLHSLIVEMRNSIKMEDGDAADRMAFETLQNAINVMRINSDAENPLIEAAYRTSHEPRSMFSKVVKELQEYPLHREDRYAIVSEFLHYAQFKKRAEPKEQQFTVMSHADAYKYTMEQFRLGWLGESVGKAVDMFMGPDKGVLVREKFKEMSGEGLREKEIASIANLIMHEGTGFIGLAMVGILILAIKTGYEKAQEEK